jgi:hypothetical protein
MSDRFFPATILGGRLHPTASPIGDPAEPRACIGGRRIRWTWLAFCILLRRGGISSAYRVATRTIRSHPADPDPIPCSPCLEL